MRHFPPPVRLISAMLLLLSAFVLTPLGGAKAGVFNPETFTLKNGMEVVVVQNHRAPVVVHMVLYKVGAADEEAGKSGIAHFFEHLMFVGTKRFPDGKFSKIVAQIGGQENAFTSSDYTGYFQRVARDRLVTVMEMEADRMRNLVLTPKRIEPERNVVLEERRQRYGNNPAALLQEQADATLYLNHPYGRPVIGWEHEIKALSVEDLRRFYRRWYAPNNAILVVAGDINAKEVRLLAEKYYGAIPKADVPPRARPAEPPHRAPRTVELSDPRVRQPQWSRTFLAPSYVQGSDTLGPTEDAYPLQILDEILGGGTTGRMYKRLVVEQKLAVDAGAGYSPMRRDLSEFYVYAVPASGVGMDKIRDAVEKELRRVVEEGVSADEVRRAIGRLQAGAVYARDSLGNGGRILGTALAIGMPVEEIESWPERIAEVTPEEVRAAAGRVLGGPSSVTAVLRSKSRETAKVSGGDDDS